MSSFTEVAADANETHDDWFGSEWEYRASSDEEWTEFVARKYNERIENKKFEHGWKRVKLSIFLSLLQLYRNRSYMLTSESSIPKRSQRLQNL